MHSISNVQQQRMKVIRVSNKRTPETQMCSLSHTLPEKPASCKAAKPKRRKIEKLKSATPKAETSKVKRSGLRVESQLAEALLSDVRAIFKSKKATKLRSQEILDALACKKRWAYVCRGKRINARRLAALVKPYGISSRDLRFQAGAYKGYKKEWFLDARSSK
jgi:hypothetical protein